MEGKERVELFGEHCIKDNNPNVPCQLLDTYKACVILNEQDKRIKELEEENKQLKDFTENTANLIDKLTEDSVFASTQLAIEELEKIYNLFEPYENSQKDTILCANNGVSFIDYLDNRIKELKGRN